MNRQTRKTNRTRDFGNIALWAGQGLLAALFLFAGGMKLVAPAEMLEGPVPLPVLFLRFIGLAEVTGAIGLILPGVFRIREELTLLAAVGLVVIMAGAVVVSSVGGPVTTAVPPAIIGVLLITIARGRWLRLPKTHGGTAARRRYFQQASVS